MTDESRTLTEIDAGEAMQLMASVPYGRVVFTKDSLPAIRPVNHLVDNGDIIIRTRLSARVTATISPSPAVVAYQADHIDPVTRLGWSVTATGFAIAVTDKAEVERLQQLLSPWVNMTMDTIIRIRPEIITGFRLAEPVTVHPGLKSQAE